MSASSLDFSHYYEELKQITNDEEGIFDTVLFSPTFINDHQKLPDSKMTLVPNKDEYINRFIEEFKHLKNDNNILQIAVMSLSESWKDEIDYHTDLGTELANVVMKSFNKHEMQVLF